MRKDFDSVRALLAGGIPLAEDPVREALHRLESDGLAIRVPYQGWFVRQHTTDEIRKLYELRMALESFSVELAYGAAGNMDAYRVYNRDLHAAIVRAARNSYLSGMMDQLQSQSEMLSVRTIRIIGRPERAIEEHRRLIERIAAHDADEAARLMNEHISSALEDILALRPETDGEPR